MGYVFLQAVEVNLSIDIKSDYKYVNVICNFLCMHRDMLRVRSGTGGDIESHLYFVVI
jgi:hypothetical protein